MAQLNYHHLRYFHEVARDGALTRTAERMNVSQSALSIQIKQLEERLGHPLFERVGRRLELTEVGRIARQHAERIFATGDAFLATLARKSDAGPPLRVGAQSTLSRNFQMTFLRPLLSKGAVPVVLRSGSLDRLLDDLQTLALDVVLSTSVPAAPVRRLAAQRVADQPVALHGAPARMNHPDLATLLAKEPLILPTESTIRAGFEALLARLDVKPTIVADVDDMAMVRLLAREEVGVAVAPPVVLADEIASGRLVTAPFDLGLAEPFYAITVNREFPHPVLSDLLSAQQG